MSNFLSAQSINVVAKTGFEINSEFRNIVINKRFEQNTYCDGNYHLIDKTGYEVGISLALNKPIRSNQSFMYGVGFRYKSWSI